MHTKSYIFCYTISIITICTFYGCNSPSTSDATAPQAQLDPTAAPAISLPSTKVIEANLKQESEVFQQLFGQAEIDFYKKKYGNAKQYFEQSLEKTSNKTLINILEDRLKTCNDAISKDPTKGIIKTATPPTLAWWENLDQDWKVVLDGKYFKGTPSDLDLNKLYKNFIMLDISQSKLSDLSGITALHNIKILNGNASQITSLAPLQHLKNIRSIQCANTPISSLDSLNELQKVRILNVPFTKINDLSPITNWTQLQSLDIRNTKVSDLSPISTHYFLEKLWIAGTPIKDLSATNKLGLLQDLDISSTPISSLAPLVKANGLRTLNISGTRISDLSPLEKLPVLSTFYCQSTPLSVQQIADFKAQHPNCTIISDY